MKVKVRECKEANREHQRSRRQYCHVGHKKDTICVARAFFYLPESIQVALLAHEIGHLMGGESETSANRIANMEFGIRIKYRDTPYGRRLETVTERETQRLKKELKYYIDFR